MTDGPVFSKNDHVKEMDENSVWQNGSRRATRRTFLHNKKAALTSGFSSIDNKKGDRPRGRSPLLILV